VRLQRGYEAHGRVRTLDIPGIYTDIVRPSCMVR
jgi:hypothetical protein